MGRATPEARDRDVIAKTLQHDIDGARTGKGDAMKPAFHIARRNRK